MGTRFGSEARCWNPLTFGRDNGTESHSLGPFSQQRWVCDYTLFGATLARVNPNLRNLPCHRSLESGGQAGKHLGRHIQTYFGIGNFTDSQAQPGRAAQNWIPLPKSATLIRLLWSPEMGRLKRRPIVWESLNTSRGGPDKVTSAAFRHKGPNFQLTVP